MTSLDGGTPTAIYQIHVDANPLTSLLLVLAMGVYTSSFVKDLFCSPRPFAPPVTRLSKCQVASLNI